MSFLHFEFLFSDLATAARESRAGKMRARVFRKFFDVMRGLKLRVLNSALRGFSPVSLSSKTIITMDIA